MPRWSQSPSTRLHRCRRLLTAPRSLALALSLSLVFASCGYHFGPQALSGGAEGERRRVVALTVLSAAAEPGVALILRRGLEREASRRGLQMIDREAVVKPMHTPQLEVHIEAVSSAPVSVARTVIDGRDAVGATGHELRVELVVYYLPPGETQIVEHRVSGVAHFQEGVLGWATERAREQAMEHAVAEACETLVVWLSASLLRFGQ